MGELKRELIENIRSEQGTVEEAEQWVAQLRAMDPYFDSSDAMLSLETSVQARRLSESMRARMGDKLGREQLVELVRRISRSEGTEAEELAWLRLVERSVPHPAVSNLIFYSEPEMTPEQVVEAALSYKPILL